MNKSLENLLCSIQERLIFLRAEKGFTKSEFANVADVQERKNELYIINYQIGTLAKSAVTLNVPINELITDEMMKKFATEIEEENEEKEKKE